MTANVSRVFGMTAMSSATLLSPAGQRRLRVEHSSSITMNHSCGRILARGMMQRTRKDMVAVRAVEDHPCHVDDGAGCFPEQDGSVIVRDDLDSLLEVLPVDIRDPVACHPQRTELLEVVLDLGRRPEARFLGGRGGEYLRDELITKSDLEHAMSALGDFGGDNRAGVEGTLHRISAIRNRRGDVVGLTCRVGRAVTGHIDMIRDIVDSPNSILFLGRPGVGKTTVIREMARVLSDEMHKRVVIIDTSNEIGGDGDVPHPAIGGARRMQVPDPSQQHRVMIEAVENHMPEIVIVDEIGTEAEALACRTIAERGVQLIGTAHGQVLENLMKNPTLSDLVGGICSVTLGDEEARARGTQKSVLERKAPPTFPLVIEMRERAMWVAHWVEDSVDCLLNGKIPIVQVRRRDGKATKNVVIEECGYDQMEERCNGSNAPPSISSIKAKKEPSTMDGINNSVFDSMFGYSEGGFGSSFSAAPVESNRPSNETVYGWAARLRDVSEEEALAELASLGYTDGQSRRREKFSFAQGTGSGKKKSKRGSSSRSNARRRR
ncbi:hypothetical protein M9435_000902 [Picochlorum sp. BPE23]|nr:hypothetical protein M9435_000902 [Picochlorum sp. BPE23]